MPIHDRTQKIVSNDEDAVMKCLATLAMEFDTTCVTSNKETIDYLKQDLFEDIIYDEKDHSQQLKVSFEVETFYKVICYDINSENMGKTLQLMQDSMSATLEKERLGAASLTYRR